MAEPQTFAQANVKTFSQLWEPLAKLYMNQKPLGQFAGIVGRAKGATSDLLYQQNLAVYAKGQNRARVAKEMQFSTARKSATVTAPAAPAPAQAKATGVGGSGYSGNAATQLGHASNPGSVSAGSTVSPTYASSTPSQFAGASAAPAAAPAPAPAAQQQYGTS